MFWMRNKENNFPLRTLISGDHANLDVSSFETVHIQIKWLLIRIVFYSFFSSLFLSNYPAVAIVSTIPQVIYDSVT